jgi:hypothetical protein
MWLSLILALQRASIPEIDVTLARARRFIGLGSGEDATQGSSHRKRI